MLKYLIQTQARSILLTEEFEDAMFPVRPGIKNALQGRNGTGQIMRKTVDGDAIIREVLTNSHNL